MKIYAFIGKTGTGKSYNALAVAKKYKINYIIDDAILIKNNKVICGKSAKTENTKIGSVKSAIFLNEDKRQDMIRVLKAENPDKILILGTSENMLSKICNALEIGEIYKKIYIEDVVSEKYIEVARDSRINDGKHVVPVPTFNIKEQFSGYFIHPLKFFNKFKHEEQLERTIIRPTFSYLGEFNISEKVLDVLVKKALDNFSEITKAYDYFCVKYENGIEVHVDIQIKYGVNIPTLSKKLKNEIINEIDKITSINISAININIKSIRR